MAMSERRSDAGIEHPDWGWKGFAVLGGLMLLGGLMAFFNPFAASLTVEIVAGLTFMMAGVLQLWLAFAAREKPAGDRWLSGVLGGALILLSVSLIANPMAGLVTLTMLVAMIFAVTGALRVGFALRERPRGSWGWILASGVVSLALAVLIFVGLPEAAAGLLGIFLAIDLTVAGAMTLALAMALYRRGRP